MFLQLTILCCDRLEDLGQGVFDGEGQSASHAQANIDITVYDDPSELATPLHLVLRPYTNRGEFEPALGGVALSADQIATLHGILGAILERLRQDRPAKRSSKRKGTSTAADAAEDAAADAADAAEDAAADAAEAAAWAAARAAEAARAASAADAADNA